MDEKENSMKFDISQEDIQELPYTTKISWFDKATMLCSICAAVGCLLVVLSSPYLTTTILLSLLLITSQLASSIGFAIILSNPVVADGNQFCKLFAFSTALIPFPFTSIIIYLFDTNGSFQVWFVSKMAPICNVDTRPFVLQVFDKQSIDEITKDCRERKDYSFDMKFYYFYRQYLLFILQTIVFYIPSWYVYVVLFCV